MKRSGQPLEPDPGRWASAYLVGIGGAGMSGVARLLLARGVVVTGSDVKDSRNVQALRERGAVVHLGHRPEQVGRPDAVVVSTAIPSNNVEIAHARREHIPVLTRAQVLAGLMRGRRSVAVAGTHGKTTTTSMISVILTATGRSPTFVIGGDLNEIGSGAEHGQGELFVAEADESDGSFLLFHPDIAVITNVEEDHLDYYTGREEIEFAFGQFARQAGTVVACWDDPGTRRALEASGRAEGLSMIRFREDSFPVRLAVPGRRNALNAGAALAVSALLGVPLADAAQALSSFTGARRRFECRGKGGGAWFVDDYAHHPSEVAATLDAARVMHPRRLVAVFQPHRYSRTEAMWRRLGESLGAADLVVLTDVYSAGEAPIPGVTGKLLADALAESSPGKRVVYLPHRSDVAPFLAGEVREGDLVITLGAGDITMTADEALNRIREAGR